MAIIRFINWMIGFIYALYTPLATTGNHSATANLRTLQFADKSPSVFSILQVRYPFPGNRF
jgi:hypothetical protein